MAWDRFPFLPTFEKARRRELYQKMATIVRGDDSEELLSLEETKRRLRLFNQRYVGIEPILVAKIVGTAEHRPDFGPGFLPRDFDTRERWRRVEQAFPLSDFPPIVVYLVGDAYFVVDGHHRVAIAKQRDIAFIDAEVTELESRYPLDADTDIAEVIHREQHQIFMEESGLDGARPMVQIECTNPLGYVELLDLVKVYGYHLMIDSGRALPAEEIAARWYDDVYRPGLDALRAEGVFEDFPNAMEADVFLWVWQRRQAFFPQHGGMTLAEAARRIKET